MKQQSWPSFFEYFFETHQLRITQILDARNCRETWLQGEIYLHNPKIIRPDCREFPKVDLHGIDADGYPEMIAEIKVIGYRGYACSDIFGFGGGRALEASLDACKNYAPDYVPPHGRTLVHSLYNDYQKLRRITRKTVNLEKALFSGERYLILVVPHRPTAVGCKGENVHDIMQKALKDVMFSREPDYWEWNFRESNDCSAAATFSVRLWRLSSADGLGSDVA